jgi:RNA polymerase sigma factor (sigma-70 family)
MKDEQIAQVLKYKGYVCTIAFNYWKWAHIPARYLDELKQDALLQLCRSVMSLNPDKGMITKITIDVKGYLNKRITRIYRTWNPTAQDMPEELLLDMLIDELEDDSSSDLLRELLSQVTPRQQEIIEKKYGLVGNAPMENEEIALSMGITKGSVNHQMSLAKNRLKSVLSKESVNVAS